MVVIIGFLPLVQVQHLTALVKGLAQAPLLALVPVVLLLGLSSRNLIVKIRSQELYRVSVLVLIH